MARMTVHVKIYMEQSEIIHAMVLMHAQEGKQDYRLATTPVTAKTAVLAFQISSTLSFHRIVVTPWPLRQEISTLSMAVLDHTHIAAFLQTDSASTAKLN